MRTLYAGFEEVFDTHLEAHRAKLRAVAHREAVAHPPPNIFVTHDRKYRVVGDAIVPTWSIGKKNGVVRERLFGTPVEPPRPKHRKGKRARYFHINNPLFGR